MGAKNVRKQNVAQENASMTFERSQYERADTKWDKSIADPSVKTWKVTN